jgi:hypothetical protein
MKDRFTHAPDFVGERKKGKRIGTLWYSDISGEGDVTLAELFDDLEEVHQLDVLSDLIGMLQREYSYLQYKKWKTIKCTQPATPSA